MTGTLSDCSGNLRPLIIPEHSHPIRPEMLDRDAVFVLRKLNKAGFSSYLVGGGVRDLYLGKQPKDFDISTDARPGQIRKLFPNSATIGRRFRLVQVFFKGGKVIEVSTLRSLSEHDIDGPEAVLAPNNTYGNLPDDAQRRDLSINSLFYELEKKTIIDHVSGVKDLDNSIIRIIGEPDKRINRDPVRMMRAIRHSARTGFIIENKTWQSICMNSQKIALCPPSRIRDEMFKDIYGGSSAAWFDAMVESEMFQAIFPLYQGLLFETSPDAPTCKQQLTTIFTILDNNHSRQHQNNRHAVLPKYFVLALLVLPWADKTFNLSKLKLKGPAYFQLSKKIRREIDNLLGVQLNLRKSIRQEMVTLLCNLPQFVRFVQNNTTPKWLKKKSYYQKCLLFYEYHMAATLEKNNNTAPDHTNRSLSPEADSTSRRTCSTKRKTKPAFSPKKKGGVFGLRKRQS